MSKPTVRTKAPFTWGIRITDLDFMRMQPREAVLEGSSTTCDCGAITKFDLKKPATPARRNPASRPSVR